MLLAVVAVFLGCDKSQPSRSTRNSRSWAEPPSGHHQARLAIILDDIGADPAATDSVFALRYPLTLSILPNHSHSREIAEHAHHLGFEVMLHLPMQSEANEMPEAQQLQVGMSRREVSAAVNSMLESVPYASGVNNHQGSLATADRSLMNALVPVLAQRHLFFIDSRTSAATVAYDTARRDSVRSAFRNVPFLDDVRDVDAIRRQLDLAVRGARDKGEAIAIGHPHPETIQALQEFLPTLESQYVQLVHASALVH